MARRWETLEGALEVVGQPLGGHVHRLSVRFANRCADAVVDRAEALRRTFLSTHVVARATGASFVSQTDPPEALRAESPGLSQRGRLAGAGRRGGPARHAAGLADHRLSDHPTVAPESPGDLFDGGEIDALLIHNIRALTDAEREEMWAKYSTPSRTDDVRLELRRGAELSAPVRGLLRSARWRWARILEEAPDFIRYAKFEGISRPGRTLTVAGRQRAGRYRRPAARFSQPGAGYHGAA